MLLPTDSRIKTSKQMNKPDFFGWFKKCNIWLHSALLNQRIGADPSVCHTPYNILLSLLSYVFLLNIIET